MASDRGVSSLLAATEVDPSWIASCEVLHVSGYCLMAEPMAEAAIYAARHARRVTVDLASAHDIELLGAQTFSSRLEALGPDLAFATEAERAAVPDFDTSWVIKHGVRGATFPEGFYPAPVVAAVDSTGAGDALAAGYLVGGPELAIATATHSVGLVGAMPSQPGLGGAS
jgi:sugar/nucleoside kinase (ribokinase family)